MKSVHKALKLRHKKHTGKLLPHRHTSYRVLFGLMLLPIIMLALVSHIAGANDYDVTATVPAPVPAEAPTITAPTNGSTVTASQITVSGTCPVVTPAVIIALYENAALIGSRVCRADGTFAIPISATLGSHSVIATVTTITNGVGASSAPVTFTRIQSTTPPGPIPSVGNVTGSPASPTPPVKIVSNNIFITISPDGDPVWHGSFSGGTPPYSVIINWGDGKQDRRVFTDQSEQSITHHYDVPNTYAIEIKVIDAAGQVYTLNTTAISPAHMLPATVSGTPKQDDGFTLFSHLPLVQIYIIAFACLIFLWYIERGRHLMALLIVVIRRFIFGSPKRKI